MSENLQLEMTSVALPIVSLIPGNIEKDLRGIVGDNYYDLTELDRIILVLAHQFGDICNTDIQCYSQHHPRDIGECLKRLVNNGWLERSGHGRGTNYTLVHKEKPDLLSLLPSSEHSELSSEHSELSSEHSELSSEHSELSSEHSELSSEHSELSSEHYKRLKDIAAPVRGKGRTNKQLVENTIIKLCSEHYLPLRTLAELLRREPDSIRNHYVNDMLKRGLLELKYPEQKNYPQQAYKTVSSLKIQTQGVSETEN